MFTIKHVCFEGEEIDDLVETARHFRLAYGDGPHSEEVEKVKRSLGVFRNNPSRPWGDLDDWEPYIEPVGHAQLRRMLEALEAIEAAIRFELDLGNWPEPTNDTERTMLAVILDARRWMLPPAERAVRHVRAALDYADQLPRDRTAVLDG